MMASTETAARLAPTTTRLGPTAYRRRGPVNAPTLVFIHGVGMNQGVWDAQVAAFADDHAVVTYDLLGHGGSDLPPDPTHLKDLSDQLRLLLDDLNIRHASIVGHSMGALVAIEFALAHADRVDRLIALNAVYRRTSEQRRAVVERAAELARDCALAGSEATIRRWFTPHERQHAPQAVARIRGWLDSANFDGYARIYNAFARSDEAFVGRLENLRAPALFMTGSQDPNSTPAMSRRLASEAPDAQAVVLENERHMMAYIAPDPINQRIRTFIDNA